MDAALLEAALQRIDGITDVTSDQDRVRTAIQRW